MVLDFATAYTSSLDLCEKLRAQLHGLVLPIASCVQTSLR